MEETRKSKSSYQNEETAWWCKENGWKREKQTKGIKKSLQFVNGRYRFVKFTSFHRVTISVYKLYR